MNIVQRFASPGQELGLMYRPRDKCIIPALIGAGAALIGSAIGSNNTHKTNAANLAIARENNAFNERMFDKQIAYNWDMFNAENQFNSPIEQAARYRAAGINPALAMEGDSMASAQGGSVSPPSASSVSPMQAYDPSAAFARVGDILYNEDRRQAELRSMELANENAELSNQDKAEEVKYNSLYRDLTLRRSKQQLMNDIWQGMLSGQQYNYNVDTYPERVRSVSADLRKKRGEADYQVQLTIAQQLENAFKKFNLEKAPEEFKARMALLGAQTEQALSGRDANYASAYASYRQGAKALAETYGVNLNNDFLRDTFGSRVDAARAKSDAEYWQSINTKWNERDKYQWLYGDSPGQTFLRRFKQTTDYLTSPVKNIFGHLK